MKRNSLNISGGNVNQEEYLSLLEKEIRRKEKLLVQLNEKIAQLTAPLKKIEMKEKDKSKYAVELKYDGFRGVLHKSGDVVKIFSDQGKDITEAFPTIVEEAKKLSDQDFILDGELVLYDSSGKHRSRADLIKFITSKEKQDDSGIIYHVFDIVYFGEDVSDLPWYARKELLGKLNWNKVKHIKEVRSVVVDNPDDLLRVAKAVSKPEFSEGAMIKDYYAPYPKGQGTSAWVKYKKLLDIIVRVVDKKKAGNAYVYTVGIDVSPSDADNLNPNYLEEVGKKLVLVLGNTFNTSLNVNIGDVIKIRVEEVWRHEGKRGIRYSIHKPHVEKKVDRNTTDSLHDLDRLVVAHGAVIRNEELELAEDDKDDEEGGTRSDAAEKYWKENWWKVFPPSGKGRYIYHYHFRGLNRDEIDKSLEELLDTNHSIHSDLRLEGRNSLWGFTIFLGTTSEVKEGDRLITGKGKYQCAPKLAQPLSWLQVAKNKPYISKPGEIGATSKKYAKFFAIDHGTYDLGVMREHFFEIFLHGKKLNGRYIIQYAPVVPGGKRIWLITKPKDQTPYADKHKLEDVINELKRKGQKYLVWAKPGRKPELIRIKD